MTSRNLRDELEATHARLAELTRLKARGFDLEQTRAQLQADLASARERRAALRLAVKEAEKAVETSRAELLTAMEGQPLDPRALSGFDRRLLLRVDGGRLFGALLGFTLALAPLSAAGALRWPALVILPLGVAAAVFNGWKRGARAREIVAEAPALEAEVSVEPEAEEEAVPAGAASQPKARTESR